MATTTTTATRRRVRRTARSAAAGALCATAALIAACTATEETDGASAVARGDDTCLEFRRALVAADELAGTATADLGWMSGLAAEHLDGAGSTLTAAGYDAAGSYWARYADTLSDISTWYNPDDQTTRDRANAAVGAVRASATDATAAEFGELAERCGFDDTALD